MTWLFGGKRLRQRGVIGINRRNAGCMLMHNPRSRLAIADDKLIMAELCARIGVPTPEILGVFECHRDLGRLPEMLAGRTEFVVKPSRGAGGRGIIIVVDRAGDRFIQANQQSLDLDDLRLHSAEILNGMYSNGSMPDRVLLQQRVRPHPLFESIAPDGAPDIRIVLYRHEPAMAMLRLPTHASGGRANLHQGGIGVGIDLASGRTHHAYFQGQPLDCHPDTGEPVLNFVMPWWLDILEMARKTARASGLGFVGIDVVIDEMDGPMLLEANARPGLAIQLANDVGLAGALTRIDAALDG